MVELVDDPKLIDGLRNGLEQAQIQLLELYSEPLVRFLHYTCEANIQDAEDIAVETLYRAIERIDSFKSSSSSQHSFRNWLFTIAKNMWIDSIRKHNNVSYFGEDDYELMPSPDAELDSDEANPEIALLHEALSELPSKQKITLLLHYEGRTLSEIAEMFEVPPGTVRQWKNRALKSLREKLQDHPVFAHRLEG